MPVPSHLLPDEWTVERSVDAIEHEWRRLQNDAVGTPFQSFEWIANLVRDEAEARRAVFVLGHREGQLCIAFALTLDHGTLRWLGEAWNNYNMPLVAADLFATLDGDAVDKIWREIRRALGNPSASILRRQPTVIDGMPNPFSAWAMVPEPTDAYALTLGADWPSFYNDLYSPSSRRTMKRKQRNLEADGKAEMRLIEDPEDIHRHIMLMLGWKSEQVDAAGRRNMLSNVKSREIFARFGRISPQSVRVYAIHLDGRPISIMLLFEARNSLVLYQMAYEEGTVSRRSPGRLLLNHVIEAMIQEHYAVLDFSVGDDVYKQDLCDIRLAMTNSIKSHSASGLPVIVKTRVGTGLKAAIKSRPPLLNAIRRVNAFIQTGSMRVAR